MQVAHSEPADVGDRCEIRLGVASWAEKGDTTTKSVKFTSFDKNGRATRSGEFPVEALPQMLDFAIRNGYLTLDYKRAKHGHRR